MPGLPQITRHSRLGRIHVGYRQQRRWPDQVLRQRQLRHLGRTDFPNSGHPTGGTPSASATKTPTPTRSPIVRLAIWRCWREGSARQRTRRDTRPLRRSCAMYFYKRFYDPETGVLGGWRSADGQLHDYYFLLVNGIAIHYGLVAKPQANAIMDKLLAKMQEVGYDKFNMGLPGNLITVTLKDYVHKNPDGHIRRRRACPTTPTASRTTRMAARPAALPSSPWPRSTIWAAKPKPTTILFPMLERIRQKRL